MATRDGGHPRTNLLDGVVSDPDWPGDGHRPGEQILRAAQKLFANQGFRDANLNDVATQLGFRRQSALPLLSVQEAE
jgi:hypothetical protein